MTKNIPFFSQERENDDEEALALAAEAASSALFDSPEIVSPENQEDLSYSGQLVYCPLRKMSWLQMKIINFTKARKHMLHFSGSEFCKSLWWISRGSQLLLR